MCVHHVLFTFRMLWTSFSFSFDLFTLTVSILNLKESLLFWLFSPCDAVSSSHLSIFIYLLRVFSVLSFPSFPRRFLSSLSSSVPPPAPSVLHLGGRAGVGLLLGDPGGKRLGSQPSITGGEPLQCASEDSQVDPDQHRPLWIFCLFSSFHFSACFCRVSFSFWLILGLLQPYCHWPPGWYQTKLLHAHSGDSCCFWRDHFSTS